MSQIGVTVVNGTATLNPQFLPEFIVIGNSGVLTAANEPTSLSVTVGGKERINVSGVNLVKFFGAVNGNLSGASGGGSVPLGNIYRIAYGGKGAENVQIRISQAAAGAAQPVYGFTSSKNEGIVVNAFTQSIQASSSQLYESFDFLAIDGDIDSIDATFSSGWQERLSKVESQAIGNMQQALADVNTIGGISNFYLNEDEIYDSVKVYTAATARTVLRIGKEVL